MSDPVRARYFAALERGMSIQAATDYANSNGEMSSDPEVEVKPVAEPEPEPVEEPKDEVGQDDLDGMDIEALRAAYVEAHPEGKKAYGAWKEHELRARIRKFRAGE